MAEKGKSLKCVVDFRNTSFGKYRLSTDGRKWKDSARHRQALAEWLATFATADGSSVRPSIPTMCEHFGWSKATMCRLLASLETLGVQKRVGRFGGKNGVAIRQLNVPVLEVSDSTVEVSDSNLSKSQIQSSKSQIHASESQIQSSKSHVGETLPPALPPTNRPPTAHEKTDGGKSLSQKHPKVAFGKETELDALLEEYKYTTVDRLLTELDTEDYTGVKNVPAAVFAEKGRLPKKLAEVRAKRAERAAQREKQARIDAFVQQQIDELIAKNRAADEKHRLEQKQGEADLAAIFGEDAVTRY